MANSAPVGQPGKTPSLRRNESATSVYKSSSSQSLSNSSERTAPAAAILASSSAQPADSRSKDPTVPAACLACRSKHLKCDGKNPCARCQGSGSDCVYVASRRGYKGPRKNQPQNPTKLQATSPPSHTPSASGDASDGSLLLGSSTGVNNTRSGPRQSFSAATGPYATPNYPFNNAPPTNADLQLFGSYSPDDSATVSNEKQQIPPTLQSFSLADRCLDSFFYHFHASHPFVLPKAFLLSLSGEPSLEPLLAAARWVGSLYIDAGNARQGLFQEAYRLIYEPQRLKDGFVVQAMMLLIVALDGSCENDKAREILGGAETLALQIGLNTRAFATLHGRGLAILEESWRRTWWDLFIIDAMIAGVHRVTNFLLYDVPADVALPCEEVQYLSGNIPQPMTLQDLENRDFSGDDREFSSFAYRILCGRNLGRFMRMPPLQGPDDDNIARIEALLTNWRLHLPQGKTDALQKNGMLDEMMFQAHMMVHATSIMLHQPFSQLDTTPTQNITTCAPYQPVAIGQVFNTHTKHTVTAACAISELITHRIRLNIGALGQLSSVWSAAERARNQVRAVARDIYQLKKQQQSNPQYWLGYSQQDMINSMAADDGIITEIEGPETLQNMQHGPQHP